MILPLAASVLSLVWVSLAFGTFPLVGIGEPLRSILLIVVDAVVIAFGIAGVIRARRANGSYVLPILILCVPTMHFLGSGLIVGEAIIAVFALPSLVLAAVTCLEGLRLLFTRQRRTL